jgi:hypothetical protein
MKAREWDKVNCKLSEVRVQLSREAKAACDTTHGSRNEVVKITNWYMEKQKHDTRVRSCCFKIFELGHGQLFFGNHQ